MQRRFIIALGLGLLGLTLLLLVSADQASAGLTLEAKEGFSNPYYASSFPADFSLDIILEGSTANQVDYIYWQSDIGSAEGGVIGGSTISYFIDAGKPLTQSISYDQPGSYTILVEVYNNSYPNGTDKPEDEKMIQEGSYPLTIVKKGGGDDDTATGLPFDIMQLVYVVAGVVVIIVIVGLVRFMQSRGGLSMPSLPKGPLTFPQGKSPLGPAGSPPISSLGSAHSPDEGPSGPVAKRDCPSCKTPIPIETDERPLKIICPNENCGKSFTLKAKSGAVPAKGPSKPSRRPKKKSAGKAASTKGKRPARRGAKPKGPKGPKAAGGKSPPRPRTPAKGKPPAPKPKPLHCPNDGNELAFYPGAAKQYGYDSDYFCSKCELYVEPREKSGGKARPKARPGKPAGAKPKAKAKAKPKAAPKEDAGEGPFSDSTPKASPLPVPDGPDGEEGDTVTCPSCDKVHEVPDAMTKNLMCTCGRRIRVKK